MKIKDAVQSIRDRISTNSFDPEKRISREEITDLIADAQQAPSSFNIQHTRFVVVTDASIRQQLQAAAYGQPKVAESSATLMVLGDLDAYQNLARTLAPSVEQGVVDQATVDTWVQMAVGMYGSNAQFRRDEVIRSASLSAMTLMIAAEAKGYSTGPMIGFDPSEVARILAIPERYVIAMMIPIGFATAANWPRKPRLPTNQVVTFETAGQLPA